MGYRLDGPNAPQAKKDLAALGLDYEKIISGEQKLEPSDIKSLAAKSITRAETSAKKIIKDFESQPDSVKEVVTEMVFQVGEAGFKKFEKTISAILAGDYETAADELVDSKVGREDPKRIKDLADKLESAVETNEEPALQWGESPAESNLTTPSNTSRTYGGKAEEAEKKEEELGTLGKVGHYIANAPWDAPAEVGDYFARVKDTYDRSKGKGLVEAEAIEPVINSELTAPVNVTKSKVETSIKKKGTPKEASLIEQATNTLIDEGVGALLSQVGNKISNVYYEKTGGKEDIVIEDKQIMTQDEWLNAVKMKVPPIVNSINTDQEWLKPSMPEVTLLSSATKNTDYKDIIYQPLAVNTTKAKFGYRNRGNNKDIKSSGALFSTYNPFRPTSKYLGWHTDEGKANFKGANASSNSVIALNTKTGEVMGGTFKDFANNPDIVVSRTLPAKKVVSIGVSKDNKYFKGISQKGTRLTLASGTQQDIPIGIGSDNSGNRLTGWSGGKMFITKPDGSEGHFVYGTVKQLSSELNKYKKTHQIDHVLWYDMDHKAFSQAYQTNTGTLFGNYNIERDNTNSTGGHFLYLK